MIIFLILVSGLFIENPLICGCESQELWEWLRDHQKLVSGVGGGRGRGRNGVGVGDVEDGLLKCQQPPELQGLVFLDLDPHEFCSAPLILKLAIQDIQPFSVLVSWQSRNHSGLHGYQVAYHALDNVDEVRLLSEFHELISTLYNEPSKLRSNIKLQIDRACIFEFLSLLHIYIYSQAILYIATFPRYPPVARYIFNFHRSNHDIHTYIPSIFLKRILTEKIII